MRALSCLVPLAVILGVQDSHAADCATVDAIERFATAQMPPADASCATYLGEGGQTGTSCHWSFPFRSADALSFADALWSTLAECRAGQAGAPDQPVNHPDSYDLREWTAARDTFAISVKDKGALRKTLVFLRFETD